MVVHRPQLGVVAAASLPPLAEPPSDVHLVAGCGSMVEGQSQKWRLVSIVCWAGTTAQVLRGAWPVLFGQAEGHLGKLGGC